MPSKNPQREDNFHWLIFSNYVKILNIGCRNPRSWSLGFSFRFHNPGYKFIYLNSVTIYLYLTIDFWYSIVLSQHSSKLQMIFIMLFRFNSWSCFISKIIIMPFLWEPGWMHSLYVSCPSEVMIDNGGLNADHWDSFYYF